MACLLGSTLVRVCVAGGVIIGLAPAARSQAPECTQATAGQLSVQAGVRCACAFVPGGGVASAPAGYRWDCGILRSREQASPAPDAYQGLLPDSFSLESIPPPDLEPQWRGGRHGR